MRSVDLICYFKTCKLVAVVSEYIILFNLVHCLVSGKTTIADGVCKPTYNRSDVNGCESWVVNLEDGQINCWKMFGR